MSSQPTLPISNPQPTTTTTTQTQQSSFPSIPVRAIFTRLSGYARSAFSNRRPWTELIDRTAFSRPDSLSDAASRVRKNAAYFRVNYLTLLALVLALFLLSHPFSLLTLIALLAAWLFLYALRPSDQPLVIFGRTYSDPQILVGLGLITLIVILVTSVASLLITAVLVGVAIVCAHGAFRDPEDLFLDEQESTGFLSVLGGSGSSGPASVVGQTMMHRI
ncbi:PRA1 family protein B1 [Ziziphus jujuba]|uniref:PRA1 family protein n=2 Tax=Ziziphus jujuba TaxID=326968 RepID=A0A6P3ZB43_ZIZJJ|nr:PRA1 family protein B1 [Ziziphus jujuba]KAH7542774.1 hypothetical protein FEM48_Zijuj02G0110600 [Ziziphus jujuba var. spinosa]